MVSKSQVVKKLGEMNRFLSQSEKEVKTASPICFVKITAAHSQDLGY
jgi:hypothetical protein